MQLPPNQIRLSQTIFKEFSKAFGENNPNQMYSLLLPGIQLTKEDFEYNYKENKPKGPTVEANESRLANKLYDPYELNGADNGQTLPYQYKSALDALTPKLNVRIANAKNKLRELLLTKYPYNFGDGVTKNYTLQEVFFRLYDEYIEEAKKWAQEQLDMKAAAEQKIGPSPEQDEWSTADKDSKKYKDGMADWTAQMKNWNQKVNDAYLEQYETVAESRLNTVNEKMSALLSVFTPNDMKILEGILDSGSGAELQEARNRMNNFKKLTPDGGYIYPCKFNPTNWFEYLDTGFKSIDLLESPRTLLDQMISLESRKSRVFNQYYSVLKKVVNDDDVKKLCTDYDTAKSDYQKAFDKQVKTSGEALKDFTIDTTKAICNAVSSKDSVDQIVSGTVGTIVKGLFEGAKKVNDAQSEVMSKMGSMTSAFQKWIAAKNYNALGAEADALFNEYNLIDSEIKSLSNKINMSLDLAKDSFNDITPPTAPEGFTTFTMCYEVDDSESTEDSESSISVSSSVKGFWVFKKREESREESSSFSSMCETKGTKIEIAMNIAKVGIEREWFNPGVFLLTKDMYRLTQPNISATTNWVTNLFGDSLHEKQTNCIFPTFPVAMIIARDISVRITASKSSSFTDMESAAEEIRKSGSYVFVNTSSTDATSSSHLHTAMHSEGNCLTMRCPTPQMIGVILENTPDDRSTYVDDNVDNGEFQMIDKFIEEYKSVIDKKNKELN